MRVLHVINHLEYGGAERLLFNFILHAKEHYPQLEMEVCVLLKEGSLGNQLRQKGIIVHNLNVEKWNFVQAIYRLYKIIKRGRYDIIHVHLFPPLYYVRLTRLLLGYPTYVFTEHSTSNRRRKNSLLRFVEHFIYRGYDAIVANSSETKQSLCFWLPKLEGKIFVIENGVPKPQTQKLCYQLANPPLLLVIARLTFDKGVDIAIDAVRILLNEGVPVRLTIVGDGTERQKLENMARGLPIKFLGFQEATEAYMVNHDILIIPSRREGFGLTAVEGLLVGIPIIAASVDFLKRNIKHRVHGLLFEPGNPKDLADKIKEMLSSKELRTKLAQHGKRLAMEKWLIERFARETIDLYEKLKRRI